MVGNNEYKHRALVQYLQTKKKVLEITPKELCLYDRQIKSLEEGILTKKARIECREIELQLHGFESTDPAVLANLTPNQLKILSTARDLYKRVRNNRLKQDLEYLVGIRERTDIILNCDQLQRTVEGYHDLQRYRSMAIDQKERESLDEALLKLSEHATHMDLVAPRVSSAVKNLQENKLVPLKRERIIRMAQPKEETKPPKKVIYYNSSTYAPGIADEIIARIFNGRLWTAMFASTLLVCSMVLPYQIAASAKAESEKIASIEVQQDQQEQNGGVKQ